jgi:regulator of cell morphogenesis and NO signaling
MESAPVLIGQRSLADLVRADARAATVLDEFGLDYCCGGRQTLEQAAAARGVPLADVIAALGALTPVPADTDSIEREALDRLIGHIVDRHHRYIREVSPAIRAWLDRLVARHGGRHPELDAVRRTFERLSEALLAHLKKEENVLFPFIDDLAAASRSKTRPAAGPFGTIVNPIRVMEADHQLAGDLATELRRLTDGFVPPADACATYRRCYAELASFEQDLHRHLHLENNVLFPRAIEVERSLV